MTDPVEEQKRRFDFDAWRGLNMLGEELFVWGFFLGGEELPGLQLRSERQLPTAGTMRFTGSMWQGLTANGELLRIDAYECASRAEAHELLLKLLGRLSVPGVTRWEGGEVGDVTFGTMGGEGALFARGNLVFQLLNASRPRVAVRDLAVRLDGELIAKPATAKTVLRAAPTPVARVQAGQTTALDPEALFGLASSKAARVAPSATAAPAAGEAVRTGRWFKFFASSCDLFAEGGEVQCRPREPGHHVVQAVAVTPGGATETRELAVEATG